jgi:hypothetical protein
MDKKTKSNGKQKPKQFAFIRLLCTFAVCLFVDKETTEVIRLQMD